MDIDSLYEKFLVAKNSDEITECIIETLKICKQLDINECSTKLNEIISHLDVFIYQTMKLLQKKDYDQAEFVIYQLVEILFPFPNNFFVLYYLLGRVNYVKGNYTRAAKFFLLNDYARSQTEGADIDDVDELSLFYRANCLAMNDSFKEAGEFYQKILEIKSDFPEVKNNLEIVRNETNKNLTLEVSSLWNYCDWKEVPIFINARDRLGVMKKLIDWLLEAGYRNLIILDNDSTYKKLLDYYSELEKDNRTKVIRLGKNLGYKALWSSNILETLKISTPYVYTDPDILPIENCPKDFVKRLFEILNNNHEIKKVGLSLLWEDITISDKELQQKRESKFLKNGYIGNDLAYANVDTTFALYSNLRHYSLRFSLRTYGDLRCRHLPWYLDYDNLPEDEKYYLEHANRNSITSVKDKILNKE